MYDEHGVGKHPRQRGDYKVGEGKVQTPSGRRGSLLLYSASAGIIFTGLLWGLTYTRIGLAALPALVPGLRISWLLFRSQDYLPVMAVTAFIYSGLAYAAFSLIRYRNHPK
jgi:hypothetical protein